LTKETGDKVVCKDCFEKDKEEAIQAMMDVILYERPYQREARQ